MSSILYGPGPSSPVAQPSRSSDPEDRWINTAWNEMSSPTLDEAAAGAEEGSEEEETKGEGKCTAKPQKTKAQTQHGQRRKVLRESAIARLTDVKMTLKNTAHDAFDLSKSLHRFVGDDERLTHATWPLYYVRGQDARSPGEAGQLADLTVFEALHLHVDARRKILSRMASEIQDELVSQDEEPGAEGEEHEELLWQKLEQTRVRIRPLEEFAVGLDKLVNIKLRPWKRIFDGPRLDDKKKEAALDEFMFQIDAWLEQLYGSPDRSPVEGHSK